MVPLVVTSPARATAAPSGSTEPVVVRFTPGMGTSQRAGELAARGYEMVDEVAGSDFVLAREGGRSVRAAAEWDDGIMEMAPLTTYRALATPDDPGYPAQWHLRAIDTEPAWDVTTGAGQIVAVLDTGVAYETFEIYRQAPDLSGTSFVTGYDFVSDDTHPNDENGHGTHVAGTVAQTTNNGRGTAGVAYGAAIMPVRVLDADGVGSDFTVAQGIRFAADHGAGIVNLSLGGDLPSSIIVDAVDYARSKGVTLVAAAGNDGTGTVTYPAALPQVIAVGAVRLDLTRPSYGTYGSALDIAAPGGDNSVDQDGDGYVDGILQQTFKNRVFDDFCYCFLNGTSMAAGHVSGVAALVRSQGVTSPDAIADVLYTTSRDLGPAGRDDEYGYGLVQAAAAVRATQTTPAQTPAPAPAPAPASQPAPAPAPAAARGIDNACPPGITPPSGFDDTAGSVHADAIACVKWWEIASGVSAMSFAPQRAVTRGQLASFVARLLQQSGVTLPSAPPDAFVDDEASIHEPRIDQLAALGIVKGRSDGTYGPESVVSRAEMATFLQRTHDQVAGTPLPSGGDRFVDDDGSVHEANIDKVAAAGLAAGTSDTTFAPTNPVLRGQMATFLSRTLDLFVATGEVPAR